MARRKSVILDAFLMLLGFLVTLYIYSKTMQPAHLGIGVFITMLFVFFLNNKKLDKGEMRRTIAGSMIITYFGVMNTADPNLKKVLFEHFWQIILAIVGFYFTSRMVNTLFNKD